MLRERPAVRRLLIAITFIPRWARFAVPIEVVFAQTTLHAGSSGYGLLLTSWGFGNDRRRRLLRARSRHPPDADARYQEHCSSPSATAVWRLSPTLAVACAFSCVGGTGNGAAWVAAVTAFQERIPLTTQSTVMSVFFALNYLMPAVGFVIGGVVTTMSSPRVAYAAAAVGTVMAVAVFARFARSTVCASALPSTSRLTEPESGPSSALAPSLRRKYR